MDVGSAMRDLSGDAAVFMMEMTDVLRNDVKKIYRKAPQTLHLFGCVNQQKNYFFPLVFNTSFRSTKGLIRINRAAPERTAEELCVRLLLNTTEGLQVDVRRPVRLLLVRHVKLTHLPQWAV